MFLFISILSIAHYVHEAQNKYKSSTNTKKVASLLKLAALSFLLMCLFSFDVNATSPKTVMNQTYFEWYKFDVNVVRILIATCTALLATFSVY